MNTPAKPRIEPLSRPAWERVEARLFERLDRGEHLVAPEPEAPARSPARLWSGVAALAAAAVFALWWQTRAPESQVAVAPTPSVVQPHDPANDGAHIVTTSGPTRTTIGEATLTLPAASEVHVTGSDADGWLVRLDRGEVDCEVAPRRGRPAFVVQAGETRVTVVGTRFSVLREGPSARVSVQEGHVQVASGPHQLSLGPGESWPSEAEVAPPGEQPEPAVAPLEPPVKKRTLAKRSVAHAEFEKAARLEAKNPEAALGIYRKLVRGKSRWAPNALYAEARLELERGRREQARALLGKYLTRYPSGANASDVRALLGRLEAGTP